MGMRRARSATLRGAAGPLTRCAGTGISFSRNETWLAGPEPPSAATGGSERGRVSLGLVASAIASPTAPIASVRGRGLRRSKLSLTPMAQPAQASSPVPQTAPAEAQLVVMKFGGTSVADAERIKRAARRIVAAKEAGSSVV